MATVSKATSGQVTTYTIVDSTGGTVTVAVTANPITGNSAVFSGTARQDSLAIIANYANLWCTNLMP